MPAKLLNDQILLQIRELFDAQLVHPVELLYFSKNESCETCDETRQLVEEVAAISEKVHFSPYSLENNPELSTKYKIELTPSLLISGRDGNNNRDYVLRFAGIPSGYEFSSFIQGILLVSKRDSGLKAEIRNELKLFTKPINLKVFVTPT